MSKMKGKTPKFIRDLAKAVWHEKQLEKAMWFRKVFLSVRYVVNKIVILIGWGFIFYHFLLGQPYQCSEAETCQDEVDE